MKLFEDIIDNHQEMTGSSDSMSKNLTSAREYSHLTPKDWYAEAAAAGYDMMFVLVIGAVDYTDNKIILTPEDADTISERLFLNVVRTYRDCSDV